MVIPSTLLYIWLCCFLPSASAVDAPSIEFIESPAIQRGSAEDVRVIGANLSGACEVVFYEPGIVCRSIEVTSDEELSVRLEVDEQCSTGRHAFRVRTTDGYSELRTFTVTPFPVGRGIDSGSALVIGTSVLGDLSDGQSDRYQVRLDKGQTLAVDIEAIRMGIDMLDIAIVVRDPNGDIVEKCDDSNLYHQDPATSLVADQSGDYSIEVLDAGRNAGERAVYLMHVHDGPCPTSVFPLGGQHGSKVDLTFHGDCNGNWVSPQVLPDVDDQSSFQLFAQRNGKTSSTAIPFRLSHLPNVIESNGNDEWGVESDIPLIKVPVAINGVLDPMKDRDCYWLQGFAGQKLDVEVFAQRLGSAADTLLTIVDSQRTILGTSDDVDSLDSRVEVVVPEDGRLGIAIEEKRGKGGEDFAYRIEIVLAQDTAEVFLPRRVRTSQEMQTIAIPLGNRVLALMAVRKDDETGEATVRFPHLPMGMKTHFIQPKIDQAVVPVVFEASKDAMLVGQLIPVEVNVHSPAGTTLGKFHQVTDLIRGPADAVYSEHVADRLAVCTREPYDVSVTIEQPRAALVQDGTLDLVVHIAREPNFEGDVILSLPWLPPWIDGEPRTIVPADKSQSTIRLRAWKKADITSWPIVVEASVGQPSTRRRSLDGSGRTNDSSTSSAGILPSAVASLPIQLMVAKSPATATFRAAAAEQGQEIEIVCQLEATEQLQVFRDLVATIEGLPNRVDCEPVSISCQSQNIIFKVHLDSTAPVGNFAGLACRLSGRVGDERSSFVASRNGELTIDQPGQIMRDENGRPLNRIEALRTKHKQRKAGSDAR